MNLSPSCNLNLHRPGIKTREDAVSRIWRVPAPPGGNQENPSGIAGSLAASDRYLVVT